MVKLKLKRARSDKDSNTVLEDTGTGIGPDNHHTMSRARIEGLVVDRSSGLITLYYDGKPNVTITVPDEIWGKWKDPDGIPSYILKHLYSTRKDSKFDVRTDNLGLKGQSFIIEEIVLTEGAFFLVTAQAQSDVAFSVQGYDAFLYGRYLMAGEVKHHIQHVFDIRKDMLRDWVYQRTFLNSEMKIGDVVRYEGTRKHPLHYSSLVISIDLMMRALNM